MSVIEERDITDVVREHGAVVPEDVEVRASLILDDHDEVERGCCYSADDLAAYHRGDWCYVGVSVKVFHGKALLAASSIWGVEHGRLAEVTADAFEYVPAVVTDDRVLAGSNLWSVTKKALADAAKHAEAIGALAWEVIA